MAKSQSRGHAAGSVAVLLASFALVLAAPLPTLNDARHLASLGHVWRSDEIVAVGNSVVDHVSACDTDARTIPQMVAGLSGRTVLDLSEGGQAMPLSLNYAAAALKRSRVRTVVTFASLLGFAARDTLDIRTAAFFRTAVQELTANDLAARVARGTLIAPETSYAYAPFRYGDVDYPGYEGIKATYFETERRAMPCPERLGSDRAFIQAYYWANFARAGLWQGNQRDLAALAEEARRTGKRFLLVLQPIDFGDLQDLVPDLVPDIRRKATQTIAALRAAGVDVIDTHDALPDPAVFADRWCACGHLQAQGRLAVASRVAERLKAAPAMATRN